MIRKPPQALWGGMTVEQKIGLLFSDYKALQMRWYWVGMRLKWQAFCIYA